MSGLRLLLVHPGASWSTHDTFLGYQAALKALGCEVFVYGLDGRIGRSISWLQHCYEQERMAGREAPEPTQADYLMHAAGGIIERAAFWQVHGIVLVSGMYVPRRVLEGLAHFAIPTGLILTESPYDEEHELRWAELADVVWTNERTSVAPLRTVNANAYYLPAAYDPWRHQAEPREDDEHVPAHDVVLVGTGFPERVELLSQVDWSGIDLGLYGNWDAVTEAGPDHPLHRFVKGGVIDNAAAAALYRRAKIGLNLYRTSKGFYQGGGHVTVAESLNPRAYELAACGCFQIGSWRAEAREVFTIPGQGVRAIGAIHPAPDPALTETEWQAAMDRGDALPTHPAYDPAQHLMEQILDHCESGMRHEYARAALELVRPHTFAARARQLLGQFMPTLRARWRGLDGAEEGEALEVAAYGD